MKAFRPLGLSNAVVANTTAPAGIQVQVSSQYEGQSADTYRITNTSAVDVYLGYGSTAAEATANSVGATAGAPTKSIWLLPATTEIFQFSPETYFSGKAASLANVQVTPGTGGI